MFGVPKVTKTCVPAQPVKRCLSRSQLWVADVNDCNHCAPWFPWPESFGLCGSGTLEIHTYNLRCKCLMTTLPQRYQCFFQILDSLLQRIVWDSSSFAQRSLWDLGRWTKFSKFVTVQAWARSFIVGTVECLEWLVCFSSCLLYTCCLWKAYSES